MRFFLGILITLPLICFAQTFQDPKRVQILTNGLPLHGIGIEIAPFYRPTLLKRDYNIFYTDYTTASELIKKHEHLPIAQQIRENTVPVDFLWHPGETLSHCMRGTRFHYAIASHVIEHVPDVLGWVIQILDILHPGGILSLAVPDKRYTFDAYRSETEVHDLIDSWLRSPYAPTPGQIFDMLSRSCDVPPDHPIPSEEGIPFEMLNRNYTDQQALHYAFHAYKSGDYLDIHCSVFTPENFRKMFLKINELGILNISISEPISTQGEFFIQFTKLGEPPVRR